MKKIVIHGNRPLSGEITISGAKNSAVALIPAAILADSPVILDGVPDIQDVYSLIEILEIMGVETVAAQGHEQVAGLQAARIGVHAQNVFGQGAHHPGAGQLRHQAG